MQRGTGLQVSALRGFVGSSSFPTFGPEVVSPQVRYCNNYSPCQLPYAAAAYGMTLLWTQVGAHTGSAMVAARMTTSSSDAVTSRQRQ